MLPQYLIRSKADGKVVAQRFGFAKKLDMAAMENIVAAGDKDFFHRYKIGRCCLYLLLEALFYKDKRKSFEVSDLLESGKEVYARLKASDMCPESFAQ